MKLDLTSQQWQFIVECMDFCAEECMNKNQLELAIRISKIQLDLLNKLQFANQVEQLVKK